MSKLFFSFLLVLSSSALFECKQISTQAHEISKRMVGGNDVSVSDFQSLNSVVTISWYNMKCYGVLVASKWVLTSAQCLTDNVMGKYDTMNPQSMHMFNVSFGRTTADQQVSQGLSKYNIVIRETYHKEGNDLPVDDIAMIRLSMDANTTFTPATLPEDDVLSQINPDNCYAASFGNVIVRETVSDGDKITRTKAKNMHVVQLPIMNKKSDMYCPMQFIPYGSTPTSMNYQRKIISKFFCAGNQTQGVDIKTATPCSDEMGTPLICKVGDKNVVTGILAVAPDCESQESPTYQPVLFTSIAKQLDYIKSVMASMPY